MIPVFPLCIAIAILWVRNMLARSTSCMMPKWKQRWLSLWRVGLWKVRILSKKVYSPSEPHLAEYNLLTETLFFFFFFSRSSQPPHWKQHQVNQHRHRIPLHRTLPTRYEPHLADSIARFSADSNFDTGENDERTCHADHGAACQYWSV